MYPVFVGCVALASTMLYRECRRRGRLAPFWVGAAGAVIASVVLWIMVTNVVTLPMWTLIAPLVAMMAATIWNLFLPLQPDQCLEDMIQFAARRKRPRHVQFTQGAALSMAAAAAFYGMYKSVNHFAPKVEAGEISC